MNEPQILAMLKDRYPSSSHVLLPHVRNSTGYAGQRTADAIAFGLYPSRGLEIEGFEVKCSRSDWLRERSDPEKAESIFRFCDRWWLVVSDETIVKDGELPNTWGLLVVKNNKLRAKVLAPKLSPMSLDRGFIASLLRQFQKEVTPTLLVKAKIDDAFQRGTEYGKTFQDHEGTKYQQLKKSVSEFEAASGVKIDQYNGTRIGSAVKHVMLHGTDRVAKDLRSLKQSLDRQIKAVEQDLRDVEQESMNETDRQKPN